MMKQISLPAAFLSVGVLSVCVLLPSINNTVNTPLVLDFMLLYLWRFFWRLDVFVLLLQRLDVITRKLLPHGSDWGPAWPRPAVLCRLWFWGHHRGWRRHLQMRGSNSRRFSGGYCSITAGGWRRVLEWERCFSCHIGKRSLSLTHLAQGQCIWPCV